MRIIAGRWKGRLLDVPQSGTRPTSDRAREALFSMLASRLGDFKDLRVADVFAGSGALAFEALSRGAGDATLVENDRAALASIRRNAEKLGATIEILTGSALRLPAGHRFDLIFADPPYAPGSGTSVLQSILASEWLAPGGWLSIETSRGEEIGPNPLQIDVVREIGPARITLLRRP